MTNILFGIKGGNAKYPCVNCLFDVNFEGYQYSKTNWPSRKGRVRSFKNGFVNKELIYWKNAFSAFVAACDNFFGNYKSKDYKKVINTFLKECKVLGCRVFQQFVKSLNEGKIPGKPSKPTNKKRIRLQC